MFHIANVGLEPLDHFQLLAVLLAIEIDRIIVLLIQKCLLLE